MNRKGKSQPGLVLWILIIAPYVFFPGIYFAFFYDWGESERLSVIIINKSDMTLQAYDKNGVLLQRTSVATGKAKGNKMKKGDMRTPEGVFSVSDIQDASTWTHDFKNDSLGAISGAYGPFFIRLNVPGQKGIGIHGTHDPSSIGKRATEGCVRLKNEELIRLSKIVKPGIPVVILPGKDDLISNK